MMDAIYYILAGLVINGIAGAFAWSLIDRDGRCYKWYKSAPYSWCQFLALQLWPIALVLSVWFKKRP